MSSREDGVTYVQDSAGKKLKLRVFQGRIWPAFPQEKLREFVNMKARDDDVIVVAYPKSGTHWIWEIVRLLHAGTADVPEVEKDKAFLECCLPADLEALPSPRSLNTHAHFELMPGDVMSNKKCKMVYVTRDPRDVAVSYFNHHRKLRHYYDGYDGEWKDYLPLFLAGQVDYESWFAFTKGWEQGIKDNPDLQIHVTSYEAFQENTTDEVRKLAQFLGLSPGAGLVEQIVKKASFDNMRSTKGANEEFEGTTEPVMYRKGKVGDWKNWFTVAQSKQFDAFFEQEMTGTAAFDLYSASKQERTNGN